MKTKIIVVNTSEKDPMYVAFENEGQVWNINPGDRVTLAVAENSSIEVKSDHIDTKGIKRPTKPE